MNEIEAKKFVDMVLEGLDLLSVSASIIRETGDIESFRKYQNKIANIISDIDDDILKPIFSKYPHLRPQ